VSGLDGSDQFIIGLEREFAGADGALTNEHTNIRSASVGLVSR
jgi:hypothetical protein